MNDRIATILRSLHYARKRDNALHSKRVGARDLKAVTGKTPSVFPVTAFKKLLIALVAGDQSNQQFSSAAFEITSGGELKYRGLMLN